MKLFSLYLYGLSLSLGIFNGVAVLFSASRLTQFAAALAAGGNLLDAATGVLGVFINLLLAAAYFVMGLVFLRRESAGTLDLSEAMVGWLGLLALIVANFFGVDLVRSVLTATSSSAP